MLVNPQAMRWLWPTTTYGTPGMVKPATSNAAPVFAVAMVRWASYQTFGMRCTRCMSLESSGFPDVVCAPETTQLFEPVEGSSSGPGTSSGAGEKEAAGREPGF